MRDIGEGEGEGEEGGREGWAVTRPVGSMLVCTECLLQRKEWPANTLFVLMSLTKLSAAAVEFLRTRRRMPQHEYGGCTGHNTVSVCALGGGESSGCDDDTLGSRTPTQYQHPISRARSTQIRRRGCPDSAAEPRPQVGKITVSKCGMNKHVACARRLRMPTPYVPGTRGQQ